MSKKENFIYVGTIIHSLSLQTLKIIPNGVIVTVNGKIADLKETVDSLEILVQKHNISKENVYLLEKGQFLIPGLIDTHIHAPQYPNSGLGYDLPLLDWLQQYTFPLEKRYVDKAFAQRIYNAVVRRTLSNGTTTSCYFATIHKNSSLVLANAARSLGQRAFIGKVNMNKNSPPDYVETSGDSYNDTKTFIEEILALKNELIKPIVTPRFALSCDMKLMTALAQLADEYDIPIQTHVSECRSEVEQVHVEYPEFKNYVDVYDKAGLITNKTILAHGVYLTSDELQVLKDKNTTVSHCPNSNSMLQSGLCPVRRFLDFGLKVSLGTDCSGGFSCSMLDAIRQALLSSIQASYNGVGAKLSLPEVFYMATLGGARALSLENTVGNFSVGKDFDALVVNLKDNPAIDLLDEYNDEQLFQKFVYLADDRMISKVYVAGRKVKDV